jgi:hypothetical protein
MLSHLRRLLTARTWWPGFAQHQNFAVTCLFHLGLFPAASPFLPASYLLPWRVVHRVHHRFPGKIRPCLAGSCLSALSCFWAFRQNRKPRTAFQTVYLALSFFGRVRSTSNNSGKDQNPGDGHVPAFGYPYKPARDISEQRPSMRSVGPRSALLPKFWALTPRKTPVVAGVL